MSEIAVGRFREGTHFSVDQNSGCWNWLLSKWDGYGKAWYEGSMRRAHIVFYTIARGTRPSQHLDHVCRNRGCVNPDHLEQVTQSENNKRAGKLTPEDVVFIRRTYRKRSNGGIYKLATKFGVTPQAIQMALSGKTWSEA